AMDGTQVIWVLTITSSLQLSGKTGWLPGQLVDVVQPVRLKTLYRRNTEDSRPEKVSYKLSLDGKDIEIHLVKNEELLGANYTETRYANGTRDYCYYQGKVANDSQSAVSISTCQGLRGFIRTAEIEYMIEPLSGSDTGDHAVFKQNNLFLRPLHCAVTNSSWRHAIPTFSMKRNLSMVWTNRQKYVEMILVVDNNEYLAMDKDYNNVRSKMFDIMNFVNAVYRPLRTIVVLVGLEVWTDEDKISVVPNMGETLDSFTKWRNTVLMSTKQHDNAQLISAIDFDDAKLGTAYMKTICSEYSTGVVQDHSENFIGTAVTLAHEFGHNLGMNHDSNGCKCPESTCIMSATLSSTISREFSSCSIEDYTVFLETTKVLPCLLRYPSVGNVIPVCGNGFLEQGEQCDCGTPECTSTCCNATLTKSDCDLPEYCTGASTDCPEDTFMMNGTPCNNQTGYCYNKDCPLLVDQCTAMWGITAEVAGDSCYSLNGPRNTMCKNLYCSGGNNQPKNGKKEQTSTSNQTCKAVIVNDSSTNHRQVLNGTKCGDGLVCQNHECMNLEAAYRNPQCAEDCKGHAVCNNMLECQCVDGWLPPDCKTAIVTLDLSDNGGLTPNSEYNMLRTTKRKPMA
uniref:Metalloproteinase n=1 Tax=Denticeps clupeoides TaxID=299321 RepID=A0AAY4EI13_9TELE